MKKFVAMEAKEFFQTSFCPQFPSESKTTTTTTTAADHFMVEDLFDFSNDEAVLTDTTFDSIPGNSTDSSTITGGDSCNSSSFSGSDPNFVADIACQNSVDGHFSGDLSVPYDDLAELEWLSNFVEESFSSEDQQKLQLMSGVKERNDDASENREFQPEPNRNNPIFSPQVSVPAKARSKRTRGPPCNWTSRLLVVSPTTSFSGPNVTIPTLTPAIPGKKPAPRKRDTGDGTATDGRRCLHCATDKTPQWRTGPMGPKTLCNACGVRYKSGRLVPEYRPAASPTFVLTKHSNSHRKVLELRRQKEIATAQQHQQQEQLLQYHQNMMLDHVSSGDDYLIHQHVGPDFRQLI